MWVYDKKQEKYRITDDLITQGFNAYGDTMYVLWTDDASVDGINEIWTDCRITRG